MWYLSVTTVAIQAAFAWWLLNREMAKKLTGIITPGSQADEELTLPPPLA